MQITNIYNATYSLQVQAGDSTQPQAVVWTQETELYIGWGVSGTRNCGENPGVHPKISRTNDSGWFQSCIGDDDSLVTLEHPDTGEQVRYLCGSPALVQPRSSSPRALRAPRVGGGLHPVSSLLGKQSTRSRATW